MKINSIEVQSVCNITKRIDSSSKTTFKDGHKPHVRVTELIYTHKDVKKSIDEKCEYSKELDYFVTVRTSQGRFVWSIPGHLC